jgi:dipeptidase
LAPSLNLNPHSENYPFSVKPDQKVSVKDILALFRDTYEGTEFDMTRNLITVNQNGEAAKSPVANPHMNRELRELLRVERERSVCSAYATYVQITQSRDWLPDMIGGVVWLGYDNPETTPHTPFYCGITRMPDSYRIDGRRSFRRDCAWWAFRRVSKLAAFRWQHMTQDIARVWQKIEDQLFQEQPKIEEKALSLYEQDPSKAREFLTEYCIQQADEAVAAYWELGDDLWAKYSRYF